MDYSAIIPSGDKEKREKGGDPLLSVSYQFPACFASTMRRTHMQEIAHVSRTTLARDKSSSTHAR